MSVNPVLTAGIALWALSFYLLFSPAVDGLTHRLEVLIQRVEKKILHKESGYGDLAASLLSILPFLGAGSLCSYLLDRSLGQSWTLSFGIIACMISGVYELGRRDGQPDQDQR